MKEIALELKSLPLWRIWLSDLLELTKFRLSFMVVVSTFAGFYMGANDEINTWLLIHTLLGTAGVACGAAVLNQVLEAAADRRMHRTQDRPIAAGRVSEQSALCFGSSLAALGLVYLLLAANFDVFCTALLTLFSYLFVYTPLKKVTPLNTLIGAIPGALPIVIGYVAANRQLNTAVLALFLILFLWQMPHFLAIAWLYREDYARGGFKMLTLNDANGKLTAWKSVAYTLMLIPCSLAPYWLGMSGPWYLVSALIGNALYLLASLGFAFNPSPASARKLFLASIFYLPFVLATLAICKL
jgi:protoheme IX farnesyltransferase